MDPFLARLNTVLSQALEASGTWSGATGAGGVVQHISYIKQVQCVCRQVVHREDTWQCKPTAQTVCVWGVGGRPERIVCIPGPPQCIAYTGLNASGACRTRHHIKQPHFNT